MAVPELHFWAANDINGATILEVPVTEDYFERLAARPALTELGFLRFQFSRQVGFGIFDSGAFQPEVFCRLLVPEVSTTRYLWGAFLDDRVQQLIARIKAGENFLIGGPGPKYYLARAALFPEQFTGTGWNIDRANGVFRWKETATAGRILNRIIDEAHANTTVDAIPDLTTSFSDSLDSAGNAWANDIAGSDEFEMPIGQSLLEDMFALEQDSALETTIFLGTVAVPRLRLDAWQSYGRDLTGPIGAATVHFKEAVNILGDLSVRGSSRRKASHVIVHGIEGAYVVVERPSWDPGEYAKVAMLESGLDTKSQPLLERIGLRWLQHQDSGENEILIPHRPGFSQASGLYFPSMPEGSGHYWIGDTVDLTTGGDAGGTWTPLDYRSEAQRVMAITMEMAQVVKDGNATERALSWHLVAELNVERNSDAGPQGASGSSAGKAGCNCLALCVGATNLVLGLGSGSLKASGEAVSGPRTNANDGSDSTVWSEGAGPGDPSIGVAEAYWAADLGASIEADGFRVLQMGGSSPSIQNVATEIRLYGSDDAGAWSWLPAGKIAADPAANDWTLVTTYTGPLALNDSGVLPFDPAAFRYWLYRAVSGGTLDWDVEEIELWSGALTGDEARAARCDHGHLHNDLAGRDAADVHPDIEERLDDLEAGTSFTDVSLPHLITATTFPLIAHRGDINDTDGLPENTLEALRLAAVRGAHGVEFDVQLTSDDEWVLMHDIGGSALNRTTNLTGDVGSSSLATIVAGDIDGGFGYRAPHAGLYNPPSLDDVLEALGPYDLVLWFHLKETSDAAGTALAEYIVAAGLVERAIVLCDGGASQAAAVKAVAANLETAVLSGILTGVESQANIDRLLSESATCTNAAFVNARNPKPVDVYREVTSHYGTDEAASITSFFGMGVRSFLTDDLPNALLYRNEFVLGIDITPAAPDLGDLGDVTLTAPAEGDMLRFDGSVWVNTPGRWEPVTDNPGTGPELVWDGDEILMTWSAT